MCATAIATGFPFAPAPIWLTARRRGAVAMAATPAAAKAPVNTGLYSVLDVAEGASMGEIKTAYRKMAKRWHPDVAGDGSASVFLQIQQAYAILSDSAKRNSYDSSMGHLGLGFRRGERFGRIRRWETDQCW
ncbi:hypothetical protein KSP40_PGU001558 [Platanthera guangdongensis]|uniref:J domain-containing protein n=1 Tax=Platanthera guangdongensis TaxID=2320717 RepID=A0ABR2LY64_9ASPA